MNFVRFLRTPFFIKHLWWLLIRDELIKEGTRGMVRFHWSEKPNADESIKYFEK